MAVERRLTELVGEVGGKLHTGRSRNDQVATDLALYLRERSEGAVELTAALMERLLAMAEAHSDWPMPGYTHLQRAQPVYLAHHLLAYFWMLRRDAARFAAVRAGAGEMPLGAGALAGTGFELDRAATAERLGFDGPSPNSIDAVASRDSALAYLAAAAICATHLSRLGGELGALGEPGVRVLRARRRLLLGLEPDAPEEEPGRRGAPSCQGASDRQRLRHARPACSTGSRSRTRRTSRRTRRRFSMPSTISSSRCVRPTACSRAFASTASGSRRRPPTSCWPRLRSPTCSSARGCRFARRTASSAGWSATRSSAAYPLSQLTREDLAAHSDLLDDSFYEVLTVRSALESKGAEGGTSSARVAEQIDAARDALAELRAS